METGRSGWCWGWCGAGALAALGCGLAFGALRRTQLEPPGPVVVWAADRGAGMLYGLDEELILARRVALAAPLDLVRAQDGRLFVLRAPRFLDELDGEGRITRELDVGRGLDLDLQAEAALLVVEGADGKRRAVRVGEDPVPALLLEWPGLRCVCGSVDSVLAGTDEGSVLRAASDGTGLLGHTALGGAIADLVPAREPGGAFALDTAGRRLVRLDAALGVRWEIALPLEARHLCAVAGEERVWIADTQAARVVRVGPGGRIELDRKLLPHTGLDRALPWTDGALLLAAPGAILQLDAQGHLAPGQGGFNYLVGLAR